MASALMGSAELAGKVASWCKNMGTTPAPENAALLARNLRTLSVRVQA